MFGRWGVPAGSHCAHLACRAFREACGIGRLKRGNCEGQATRTRSLVYWRPVTSRMNGASRLSHHQHRRHRQAELCWRVTPEDIGNGDRTGALTAAREPTALASPARNHGGHRRHRMPVSTHPAGTPACGARSVHDVRGATCGSVSVQVCFSHSRGTQRQIRLTHTSVTARSPAGRSRTDVGRRSRSRACGPAYRAPASGRGHLDGVLDLAVALRDGEHRHAFQPKHRRRTTVLNHLGPFCSCSEHHESGGPRPHPQSQADNRIS